MSHVEVTVNSLIVSLINRHSCGLRHWRTSYHVTINISKAKLSVFLHSFHWFLCSVNISKLYGAESVSQLTPEPARGKETLTRFSNTGKHPWMSRDSEGQWDGVDIETEGWRLDNMEWCSFGNCPNCLPYVRTSPARRWVTFVGDRRTCLVLLAVRTWPYYVYVRVFCGRHWSPETIWQEVTSKSQYRTSK